MALNTSFEFAQTQDYDCWITSPLVSMLSSLGIEFFDKHYDVSKRIVFGIDGQKKIVLLEDRPAKDSFEAVSRAVRSIISKQTCGHKVPSVVPQALLDSSNDYTESVQFQQQELPCISPGCPKTIFELFSNTEAQKKAIVNGTSIVLCNRSMDWKRFFYSNIEDDTLKKVLRNYNIIKVLVLDFDRTHAVAFIEYSHQYDLVYYVDPSHGEAKRCRSHDIYMMCTIPKHLLVN